MCFAFEVENMLVLLEMNSAELVFFMQKLKFNRLKIYVITLISNILRIIYKLISFDYKIAFILHAL